MNPFRHITRILAPALLLSGLLAGCARHAPLDPMQSAEPAPQVVDDAIPPPPSRLTATPTDSTDFLPILDPLLPKLWYLLCQKEVLAGRLETVKANRYELTFARGSLVQDITCTIREYDKDVLDIELGPHGTQFAEPVTLSIDFRDTAADPGSITADGSEPVVWWWNEARNRWEEVPGRTDWLERRHIVRLPHFSRYVVGGKAGWKHQPRTESE